MFAAEKEKIHIMKADATKLPHTSRQFRLVFMDAPYARGLSEKVLNELVVKKWFAVGALCIVETRVDETIEIPKTLKILDSRVYGLARILFLQYTE